MSNLVNTECQQKQSDVIEIMAPEYNGNTAMKTMEHYLAENSTEAVEETKLNVLQTILSLEVDEHTSTNAD